MKDGSQTRSGADTPRAELLKPKNKIRVGSWNVRTLYQAGKLQQVLWEMENYKVELLCVSEARWIDSGKRTLSSGHTILYSGQSDNKHRGGVAIIVTRKVEKTLLEWKPINNRLLKARFNSKFAKLTVIACYAPTEDAEEEIKDEFYDQLEEEIRTTPRVGEENTGRERAMGTESFGCINNNGERLSDLCVENNLVIGGTLFKHRNIHKTTWRSPDNNTVSQINHVIVNQKWRRSLQDVRARRGADVGSDHVLVVATLSLTILNKEAPRNQAEIPESKEDLKVNTDPPSAEEVRKSIRTTKSGKAPGADRVSAEMLKAGGEVTMGALTEIFEGIWETEETPGDWKMGLIVKLPKKGDLSLCKNWRGITLLSITSKVFSRVILDRISEALDPMLRKEQAGFRKGKSCGDHIFTLRQILEQCQEWNTPFYANFVIIKLLYGDFRTKVICGQYLTEDF